MVFAAKKIKQRSTLLLNSRLASVVKSFDMLGPSLEVPWQKNGCDDLGHFLS